MNEREEKFREAIKAAALHPMMPTKYNSYERKKLRDFEQNLLSESDKKKLVKLINGEEAIER